MSASGPQPGDKTTVRGNSEGISRVRFSPRGTVLAAASWDKSVTVYNPAAAPVSTFSTWAPVLDVTFTDEEHITLSGGLDCAVTRYDHKAGTAVELGSHTEAVRCVEFAAKDGLCISGSWDGTVKVWDPRLAAAKPIRDIDAGERVYSACIRDHDLIVATGGADRGLILYDVRRLGMGEAGRDVQILKTSTNLRMQTRCVRLMPDVRGYIVSSVEGRCSVDFYPAPGSEPAGAAFTFKCHRRTGPPEEIHAVHAVAFNPVHRTFLTGGGDGTFCSWDWRARKRLYQSEAFPTSISSIDVHPDGRHVAVAVSYAFEQGEKAHPADRILLRQLPEDGVRAR